MKRGEEEKEAGSFKRHITTSALGQHIKMHIINSTNGNFKHSGISKFGHRNS